MSNILWWQKSALLSKRRWKKSVESTNTHTHSQHTNTHTHAQTHQLCLSLVNCVKLVFLFHTYSLIHSHTNPNPGLLALPAYIKLHPSLAHSNCYLVSFIRLARTIYTRRIWPHSGWFPCQKLKIPSILRLYVWFWPTLHFWTSVMANASSTPNGALICPPARSRPRPRPPTPPTLTLPPFPTQIHTRAHTYTHTRAHTHTHTHTHIHTHTHVFAGNALVRCRDVGCPASHAWRPGHQKQGSAREAAVGRCVCVCVCAYVSVWVCVCEHVLCVYAYVRLGK